MGSLDGNGNVETIAQEVIANDVRNQAELGRPGKAAVVGGQTTTHQNTRKYPLWIYGGGCFLIIAAMLLGSVGLLDHWFGGDYTDELISGYLHDVGLPVPSEFDVALVNTNSSGPASNINSSGPQVNTNSSIPVIVTPPPVKLLLTIQSDLANIRFGPSPSFGYYWGAKKGAQFYAIGTNTDRTWYLIKRLDKGGNEGWISAFDGNGNPEVNVSGDPTTLPDASWNVTFVTSPDVPAPSGSVTKGTGNTAVVKWDAVTPINTQAQANANTDEYIVQVQTIEDGKTVYHTVPTNDTSVKLTPTFPGSFQIVKARVIVQEILPSGEAAYSESDLVLSSDAEFEP